MKRPPNNLPPDNAEGNWNGEDIAARLRALRAEADALAVMGFTAEAAQIDVICECLRLAHIDRYFTDRRASVRRRPRSFAGRLDDLRST